MKRLVGLLIFPIFLSLVFSSCCGWCSRPQESTAKIQCPEVVPPAPAPTPAPVEEPVEEKG